MLYRLLQYSGVKRSSRILLEAESLVESIDDSDDSKRYRVALRLLLSEFGRPMAWFVPSILSTILSDISFRRPLLWGSGEGARYATSLGFFSDLDSDCKMDDINTLTKYRYTLKVY
jgi:hypothetical protein